MVSIRSYPVRNVVSSESPENQGVYPLLMAMIWKFVVLLSNVSWCVKSLQGFLLPLRRLDLFLFSLLIVCNLQVVQFSSQHLVNSK